MVDFIREDFAKLVLTAAVAVRNAYATNPSTGYIPRQAPVDYDENELGWPATVRSWSSSPDEDSPMDWGSVIRREKDHYSVRGADVPEVQELVDFVVSRPDLAAGVRGLSLTTDPDLAARLVGFDTVRVLTSLLNRAEALRDSSELTLTALLQELDRGLFAEELLGDLVIPIVLRSFDVEEPFQLGDGVVIEALSENAQRARATSVAGSDVNPYLLAAATHAIVLKNRTLDNTEGSLARRVRLSYKPPGVDEADLVCQALNIASGLDVGYAQICLRPSGWADDWILDLPALDVVGTVERYPVRLNDRGWLKEQKSISADQLQFAGQVFTALSGGDRRAKLAARRLSQTSRRDLPEDRLIDACIGIEALLGEQKDELGHRMGLRAATALAPKGWDPGVAYDVLKKVYNQRSEIVHGAEPKKAKITIRDDQYTPDVLAIFLLRALLKAHLSSSPPWTTADLDQALLDQLARKPDAVSRE